MKTALTAGTALLIALLLGCTAPEEPEQAIRENIESLQAALAERSSGDAMDILADSFLGGRAGQLDMDREDARKMLAVYFLRYHKIRIAVTQVDVQLDIHEPALAQATASVALAGGERLLPNAVGFYQVESRWREIDGDWKMTRLLWRQVTGH